VCRPHNPAETALRGVGSQKSGDDCEETGAGGYAALWPLTEPPADHSVNWPSCRADSASRAIRLHGPHQVVISLPRLKYRCIDFVAAVEIH
jgi:hypothetical protein